MTVQELIDILMKYNDKSLKISVRDFEGNRTKDVHVAIEDDIFDDGKVVLIDEA